MKTILVPSDFSKNSSTALRYALLLEGQFGGKIILFHCSHIPANVLIEATTPTAQELVTRNDIAEKTGRLQQQLDNACKQAGLDVPRSTKLLVESNPFVVENILEVAERLKVNLIVMGTHGATGVQKFFFGSNTSGLISKSTLPVLAIPGLYRYRPVNRIVFATDLHDFKNELKRVLPFAKATCADLNILYLDYGPGITGTHFEEAGKQLSKISYKNISLVKRKASIEIPLLVQLNTEVKKLKPSWVVMFTKERSFWDKLFKKSKTERMAYSLKYPLLSFKKDPLSC